MNDSSQSLFPLADSSDNNVVLQSNQSFFRFIHGIDESHARRCNTAEILQSIVSSCRCLEATDQDQWSQGPVEQQLVSRSGPVRYLAGR